MRRLVFAVACLLASGVAAQDATTPGAAGAEAVVRDYSDAVADGDWNAAAGLISPADLDRFVSFTRMLVEQEPMMSAVLGIDPAGDPADLLASFIGRASQMNPAMEEMMSSVEIEILGTVLENDSLAHVVARTRMTLLERSFSSVEVNTVLWDGVRWFVGLSGDLEAMMVGMEAALESPEMFEGPELEIEAPILRDPKKQ